jgi:tetratricopeptide (TPR) repeat protein
MAYAIPEAPPKSYNEQELRRVLEELLSSGERKLVVDPLERSPAMDQWVREMTREATNEMGKATLLFAAVESRADNRSLIANERSHTAKEVFASWHEPAFLIRCHEASHLYVALARAAGLKAFVVDVRQRFDGGKSPHSCAAVYLDGQRFLVDPTYGWFGAPHSEVAVLDDVQAMALHLGGRSSSLEQRRIAVKLGPDIPIVRYNLCLSLMRAGLRDEAREHLSQLAGMDKTGLYTTTLEVEFALQDRDWPKAELYARKGMEMIPDDAIFRIQMGEAYMGQGKLEAARAAFQGALKVPHTPGQAASVSNALKQIESSIQSDR